MSALLSTVSHQAQSKSNKLGSRWSAICRGATLWGLEHSDLLKPEANLPTVTSRLSRHSYGVSLSPIFDPKKHLLIDKYTDGLGIDRANRQMTWYLRRVSLSKHHRTFHISTH